MDSGLELIKNHRSEAKQATSLITIISPCIPVQQLRDLIKREQTTVCNIKSNSNRKSATCALNRAFSALVGYKHIPETGIAIFSGQYI